jgi:outer membrane protein assembly factor BamB
VYGLTKSGSLYGISEGGKKIWSAALSYPNASSIELIGSTLYVTQAEQLAAVDAVTGKIKWKISEDSNIYIGLTDVTETEGVLIRNYISEGAISLVEIVAYEAKTGKKLWEKYRQSIRIQPEERGIKG